MAVRFREYWFGGLLGLFVVLFLLFVVVVAMAPHNDMKMRGFAPCTYQMTTELNLAAGERQIWDVMSTVGKGYWCYAGVMRMGMAKWYAGEQETPWANYFFVPLTDVATPEESEPFSEDLLKANLLEDNGKSSFIVNEENKESIDE
ncbi:MAG: hypothetical protein NC218_06325 [Acetobacter sp.]|nr:hypothetical protein [Acetobacter sp.]